MGEFGGGSFTFAVNFSVSEMYLAGASPKLVKPRRCPVPFTAAVLGREEKPESFPTRWQLADTTRSAELPPRFLAMKAFSACCCFSLFGTMLFLGIGGCSLEICSPKTPQIWPGQ